MDQQWERVSNIAYPYLFLFMAFGDTAITLETSPEEDRAETQRRWACAYRIGRGAGSFCSTSLRNKPSI
jgi:hypothetical protein